MPWIIVMNLIRSLLIFADKRLSVLKTVVIYILLLLPLAASAQITRVDDISIDGNRNFTESELRSSMVTKKGAIFNKAQFETDLMTIRNLYKNDGYLFVKLRESSLIFNDDSTLVSITIAIEEGDEVGLGEIIINGNKEFSDPKIISTLNLKKGEKLNDRELEAGISELLANYESAGMPFAVVKIGSVEMYESASGKKLRLTLDIEENSRVKIGQVKIEGNTSTNDEVILRELKLGEDKLVNSATLSGIKERLDRLNIFSNVEQPRIFSVKGKEESGLLINVTEGNTNTFDGIIGYSPPTATESGFISGSAFVSFRNLFGTGRKLEARYLQEKKRTQELEFRYLEPYTFNLPLNINLGFQQRIQDTTYTRRNLDIKLDFLFADRVTVSALGAYERVIPSEGDSSSFVIADSRTLSSGVEIKYDSRDNVYVPNSGILYRTLYSIGERDIFNFSELSSQGFPESYSIQKYFINLEVFTSFFERQSLLTALNGGEIISDKVEESDLFRIGGNRYIRGYRVAQILAGGLFAGTAELRYAISRRGFFFGFYDGGYYYRPEDPSNNIPRQEDFIFGYGLGVRLETGLGLVSVSYALNKESSILDGVIGFGLVNDF